MITDGFYNDSAPPSPGNVDATKGPLYTYTLDSNKSYQYIPGSKTDPRSIGKSDLPSGSSTGSYTNSLADIAMKYWVCLLYTSDAADE